MVVEGASVEVEGTAVVGAAEEVLAAVVVEDARVDVEGTAVVGAAVEVLAAVVVEGARVDVKGTVVVFAAVVVLVGHIMVQFKVLSAFLAYKSALAEWKEVLYTP